MVDDFYFHTVDVRNPQASTPLRFQIKANVELEEIYNNVRLNSQLPYPWIARQEPQEREIVIVGGGPSMPQYFDTIRELRDNGAFVMACNGASSWLSKGNLYPDTQVILDARLETAELVDFEAKSHCFASQVHPYTMESVSDVIVFHLATPGVEEHLPEHRVTAGGYTLIGGGAAVGNTAVCLAYVLGYRKIHIFGMDSSMSDGQLHAYSQPLNDTDACITLRFGDQMYWTTFPMRIQADYFLSISAQLEAAGCEFEIYGDGLLPDMYRARKQIVDERTKYEFVWKCDKYGLDSPALECLEDIVDFAPVGPILDIGCGTGEASLSLAQKGYSPLLTDITENSRTLPAMTLDFMQWDWSEAPLDLPFEYGFCCDVMEHIPEDSVDDVLKNIRACCENVFFRIESDEDNFGPLLLGSSLHLTVKDREWWKLKLHEYWPSVADKGNGKFVCTTDTW